MHVAYGVQVPQTLEDLCRPDRMALIVYDMQIGILRQLTDAADVIQRVQRVVQAARQAGLRIIFMRHLSLPPKLMGAFQFRMAMAWQRVDDPSQVRPWFLRDSPGFAIVPELAPQADEAVFDKITMSAFEGTPLAITLRDCGLTAFAIVGVALEIGIEPTVRHGADLGLIPVIVRDACGAGDKQAAERSLESLAFLGDAIQTEMETFCRVLTQAAAAAPIAP
ncbi:cysteine hydrolase [Bosea sp. F3-2]|uniref:cysteine hydrolase family protein n=1 Tax=Bosea sp. F3-2 TaxID=2599640 RepID=UPI0011EFAB80|nr:cysteine hydrolase [Bosea sp. F3-2]QEL22701.1 cysteine hydrolase [Bosea sp. F3-2]